MIDRPIIRPISPNVKLFSEKTVNPKDGGVEFGGVMGEAWALARRNLENEGFNVAPVEFVPLQDAQNRPAALEAVAGSDPSREIVVCVGPYSPRPEGRWHWTQPLFATLRAAFARTDSGLDALDQGARIAFVRGTKFEDAAVAHFSHNPRVPVGSIGEAKDELTARRADALIALEPMVKDELAKGEYMQVSGRLSLPGDSGASYALAPAVQDTESGRIATRAIEYGIYLYLKFSGLEEFNAQHDTNLLRPEGTEAFLKRIENNAGIARPG